MQKLGKSSIEISNIVFGAWAIGGWFWGGTDDREAIRAIHASIYSGVDTFDTAPVYGFGHSESILGNALAGRRHNVKILTKIGLRWDSEIGAHFFDVPPDEGNKRIFRNLRPSSIRYEVEQSLRRLQTDYIDLLQCHWPDPSHPVEDTMNTLKQLQQEGKIRAIGVSNFDVSLLERSTSALGDTPLASNQPRYSLLNRRIERDVLPWLVENQVDAIVYSPIEQGLLAGAVPPDRVFPPGDGRIKNPMFRPHNRIAILAALDAINPLCEKYNCNYAQLCSAWCFHRPGVRAAIVGARNEQQAIENAHSATLKLSAEDVHFLTQHFASLRCCRKP
ncbi:MAG: aldo/keto reductase [Myxococcota bacterium]|nr:aldo/keto reductase [Myxococcota bacterium]